MSLRLAVITPYHKEPFAFLEQCHRSVMSQDLDVTHFMVADGYPHDGLDAWNIKHIKLPSAHADYGNTPRGIGSLLASSEGYDFISYLDADNWFHDGHLRSLVQLWEQTRSAACCSFRSYHDRTGKDLGIHERDEEKLLHIDTSCFLLHRSAFACLTIWLDMPRALASVGDRIFLAGLLHRKLPISSTRARSVAYRSHSRAHYLMANHPVPEGARDIDLKADAWRYLTTGEGVSRSVSALGFWPPSYIQL